MQVRAVIVACALAISIPSVASAGGQGALRATAPTTTTNNAVAKAAARTEAAKGHAINYVQTTYGGKWRPVGRVTKADGDPHLNVTVERKGAIRRWTSNISRMRVPVNPRTGAIDEAAAEGSIEAGKAMQVAKSPTTQKIAMAVAPAIGALAAKQGLHLDTTAIVGTLVGGGATVGGFTAGRSMGARQAIGKAAPEIIRAEDQPTPEEAANYTQQARVQYVAKKLSDQK